ncbi:PREDICTED: protein LURP-one-related 16-like isoform X3 [Camelina sativa]|uniref:Protein LURP-one-related 16-like isoform X3 n=1 Tax=Camelina sativa TaxID=90675 RepID=A0ABM0XZD1_CAMSA|nr:PREDICTED: protein LURP-one-related 16-like isoform X3 [Camelina sativa]
MGARSSHTVDPVVSRRYSSESEAVLVVRRRPSMVNGGGFVVSNNKQQVVFRVDGCGVLGTKGKLLLTNGDGVNLLLIRKMILSTHKSYVEIKGSFTERDCNIMNSDGRAIAKVRTDKEMEEMVGNKTTDLYHVIVKPNVDQAFIIGLIAVLDYIHGESTIC